MTKVRKATCNVRNLSLCEKFELFMMLLFQYYIYYFWTRLTTCEQWCRLMYFLYKLKVIITYCCALFYFVRKKVAFCKIYNYKTLLLRVLKSDFFRFWRLAFSSCVISNGYTCINIFYSFSNFPFTQCGLKVKSLTSSFQ